jgi:hypothetical protein
VRHVLRAVQGKRHRFELDAAASSQLRIRRARHSAERVRKSHVNVPVGPNITHEGCVPANGCVGRVACQVPLWQHPNSNSYSCLFESSRSEIPARNQVTVSTRATLLSETSGRRFMTLAAGYLHRRGVGGIPPLLPTKVPVFDCSERMGPWRFRHSGEPTRDGSPPGSFLRRAARVPDKHTVPG